MVSVVRVFVVSDGFDSVLGCVFVNTSRLKLAAAIWKCTDLFHKNLFVCLKIFLVINSTTELN